MRSNLSALPIAALLALAAPLAAQSTTLVSATPAGIPGNAASAACSITDNGRFVLFSSKATDLVAGDTLDKYEPFVRDLKTGKLARVALDDAGTEANADSTAMGCSSDGRFVVFQSHATNLVPGDTNGQPDIFLHDTKLGLTTRISVAAAGDQGNGQSNIARISASGRFVVFASDATNLVEGVTTSTEDVFLVDRKTGVVELISVATDGTEGNGLSEQPSVSSNGRMVAFVSQATNLVANDTNGKRDVFVHDRKTGVTIRASESAAGVQATGGTNGSYNEMISGNGRYVLIASDATELVPGDTNAQPDLFVRDLKKGTVERVSVGPAGEEGNGPTNLGGGSLWISASGRWITFNSGATNLVTTTDGNGGANDIFLRDRQKQKTVEVDIAFDGAQTITGGAEGAVSGNGRIVVFSSIDGNLTPESSQGPANSRDVYVHDLH